MNFLVIPCCAALNVLIFNSWSVQHYKRFIVTLMITSDNDVLWSDPTEISPNRYFLSHSATNFASPIVPTNRTLSNHQALARVYGVRPTRWADNVTWHTSRDVTRPEACAYTRTLFGTRSATRSDTRPLEGVVRSAVRRPATAATDARDLGEDVSSLFVVRRSRNVVVVVVVVRHKIILGRLRLSPVQLHRLANSRYRENLQRTAPTWQWWTKVNLKVANC